MTPECPLYTVKVGILYDGKSARFINGNFLNRVIWRTLCFKARYFTPIVLLSAY